MCRPARRAFDRLSSDWRLVLGLSLGIALVQTLSRYVHIRFGDEPVAFDAREVWYPLALAVLDGTPLYLGNAADNKPPLFEFLNILVASTGHYFPVFYILVGTANGLAAFLLWRYLDGRGWPRTGAVAALLFLSAVPAVHGTHINVRSFALLGILGAILSRSPIVGGASLAVAGLVSQFAVLAIPVVAWERIRQFDVRGRSRWLAAFGAVGIGVILVAFGIVAVVWGVDSALAGIRSSFGSAGRYATESSSPAPWSLPRLWGFWLVLYAGRIIHVLIPAVACLYQSLPATFDGKWGLSQFVSVLALLLLLPLGVRSYPYYWLLPLPFLSTLAAFALGRFLRGSTE